MLQTRNCRGFHRPTSTHFATIGSAHSATKVPVVNTTDRR